MCLPLSVPGTSLRFPTPASCSQPMTTILRLRATLFAWRPPSPSGKLWGSSPQPKDAWWGKAEGSPGALGSGPSSVSRARRPALWLLVGSAAPFSPARWVDGGAVDGAWGLSQGNGGACGQVRARSRVEDDDDEEEEEEKGEEDAHPQECCHQATPLKAQMQKP